MRSDKLKLIVDRFEGDFAVCEREDGTMVDIEKYKLPEGVKEGHVLIVGENNIIIDEKATEDRREKIRKLMEKLREK